MVLPFLANRNGANYASWTFRKAEKFFDVVTYTGTGSARTVSHNLGSVPGCIMVKRTDTSADWQVFHRIVNRNRYLVLNSKAAQATGTDRWDSTDPTSTVFSLGTSSDVNASGGTYVAYLFAHNAGGFGDAGDQSIISCGSYTGNGSFTGPTITLGWEPQWVLIKQSTQAGTRWTITDNMRGFPVTSAAQQQILQPDTTEVENSVMYIQPTSTGFKVVDVDSDVNTSGETYIYIAIRRGPMKTPTSATSVFTPTARTGTGASATFTGAGFPVDSSWIRFRGSLEGTYIEDRIRGANRVLDTTSTGAQSSQTQYITAFDSMTGYTLGTNSGVNGSSSTYINWDLRRAPGFFDVVCYTGTGSATTVSHNLGVVPELMIVKRRSTTNDWAVYANNDNTDYLVLNTTAATVDDNTYWNDTSPTSSVFSVGTNNATNASGSTYVAYLFASVSGVSKVGSYTGNGSSVTVTTNFQPRFILVKRTDSTGDWLVSDSARGLVAGNDPYLLLNSTAAEDTDEDWVDVSSTGFTVNQVTASNANVNTGSYIYLAIA
jgi:hypothetical protein